ncbi:hypothetical protein SKPI104516_15485 [Skermania piniformis]
MGGEPRNVDIWDSADVWIHRTAGVTDVADIVPASIEIEFDAVPDADWELVGLLNGEDGFAETVEFDESSYNAWGYGEILKSFRNRRLERKFTALERNAVTAYLESPGDTDTHVVDAKPARVYLGFETRTDDGKTKRRITTVPSTVKSGGRTDNEQDMASVEYTCAIFPNGLKQRFIKQETGLLVPEPTTPLTYTVAVTGSPTGGTWTATVGGQTTSGIPYDATAGEVEAPLEALSTVSAATVTGSDGGPWTVTVPAALTASGAGLIGGTAPSVTVTPV